MNLSKLKEKRLRKKFDKNVSKLIENRTVSQKEIVTVGILTEESIATELDIKSIIETTLGIRNSKMYSFKHFNKLDEVSYKDFTEKDINWKGDFIEPTFQSFLDQPFDLLIGYFNKNNIYLEIAVNQSKATFKAGFTGVNDQLYELEILEKISNTKQFTAELKKYLQILKKLKN
ncbi:hypothetical protein [uncultured Polaribacter sp.]|uniref:DUF6913 domain-containing protein n=1 Tax=uncultured Polaribacter sp. TaxID=174711 RepID=UPI0026206ABB|nr:hypothetical protein [uncultured Polaribacter sp.]